MSLEEAQNEKAAIKEEICLIERNLSENYEEELIKLYNEIIKNPGNKRVSLLLKTPFGFSLKVDTNLRTSL
jgi:DNA polymerase-3 subunit alpha